MPSTYALLRRAFFGLLAIGWSASALNAADITPPVTQIFFSSAGYLNPVTNQRFFPHGVAFTLQATDPAPNATGVAATYYRFHSELIFYSSVFQVFQGSITMDDTLQAIEFHSIDNAGNVENDKSFNVFIDTHAPRSTLPFSSTLLLNGTVQVTTATVFEVLAVDPAITATPSGLKDQWRSIDGGPFVRSSGTFVLQATSSSFHTIRYFSRDNVLNAEVIQSTTVFVRRTPPDTVPPVTQLTFTTAPYLAGSTRYISSTTGIGFAASDPGVDATGVAYSEYLLHPSTGPNFRRYGSPFTLAGASYSIDYRSRDNAGNLENAKTEFFRVDGAAPISQLIFVSKTGAQGVPEISTTTVFQLSAVDPVVNNVASGLKDRWLRIDGGAFAPSTGTFKLSASSNTFRTLYFFSRDNVLNREVIKSTTVFVRVSSGPVGSVDTVPPLTQLIFSSAPYTNPYGYRYVSTSTILRLAAVDPQPNASGVAFSEYRISPATSSAFTRYASTFTLTSGSRRVDYRSQDASGNLEAIRSDGLRVDGAAPISSLSFASAQISSTTAIQVNAVDPVVDNVASGVKDRWVKIDTGPFVLSTSPFFIQVPNSGPHTISFYSRDNVLNQDVVRSSTIFVTGSTIVQPATGTLLGPVGGSDIFKSRWVGCEGQVTNNQEPVLPHGSVSAVRNGNLLNIQVMLQGGDPNQTYSIEVFEAAPTCSETDNQANTGTLLTTNASGNGQAQFTLTLPRRTPGFATLGDGRGTDQAVVVLDASQSTGAGDRFAAGPIPFAPTLPDTTPPVTQFSFSTAPYINSYGTRFISSSTLITLTATDTPARPTDVFWGVARTEYRIRPSGNATFQTYVTPFGLPGNGSWGVDLQSLDNGGNQEAISTITVRVDAVPPVSQLVIPSTPVTPSTPLQLLATDPNVNNVTSGVKDRWVQIDAGAFTPVTGNFFIPASSSGLHTIHYYSRDNVLNREVVRSTSVFVQAGLSGLSALTAPSREKTLSAGSSSTDAPRPPAATLESQSQTEVTTRGVARVSLYSTDFVLHKTFAFPNPARGGAAPVIHVEVGQADEVTIRIYDAAGRLLQDVTLTQAPSPIDSGAGLELAYEYTWDGGHPSGVYFYTIKAKRAGVDDIQAKGKFAVIR